jgi:hypothetical protein
MERSAVRPALPVLALLCTLGCGTEGEDMPPPDLWPLSGVSGYVLYDPDSPLLLSQPGYNLDQPAAIPQSSAGGMVVWGRMASAEQGSPSQLFSAQVPTLDNPGNPQPALQPTLVWEGQSLSSPSITATNPPLLFYQGTDNSVGLARLDPNGVTKLALTAPLVTAAVLGGGRLVGRVSAALDPNPNGDNLRLYYTVDDFEVYVAVTAAAPLLNAGDGPLPDDISWQVSAVGLVASDFILQGPASTTAQAARISDLSVQRVITPALRVRWDLSMVATTTNISSLVSAAAYDQVDGTDLFTAAAAPLLSTDAGTLLSPSVTTFSGQPLLLVGLQEVHIGIAAAELPSELAAQMAAQMPTQMPAQQ